MIRFSKGNRRAVVVLEIQIDTERIGIDVFVVDQSLNERRIWISC